MKKNHAPFLRARQRGAVLLFCLIILVVLLAGGVAVMRSMDTSLTGAGNLAFKRDLLNRGELAVSQVMTAFKPGGTLDSATKTAASIPATNYSAIELATNEHGIPEVLMKKGSNPSGADVNGNTFSPTGADIDGGTIDKVASGVKVRYVIDRLCNSTGSFATLGKSRCVFTPASTQVTGGSSQRAQDDLPTPVPAIYRVSIRVDGPRDTQVFMQASFTNPE